MTLSHLQVHLPIAGLLSCGLGPFMVLVGLGQVKISVGSVGLGPEILGWLSKYGPTSNSGGSTITEPHELEQVCT